MKQDFDIFSLKDKSEFLPGMDAWLPLAPPGRFPLPGSQIEYRQSAVAIVLFYLESELSTLVLLRTSNENDRHSGQISFPGGMAEPSDVDPIETALRELYEETGVILSRDRLIGKMTTLSIPVSRFKVDPIVFFSDDKPDVFLSEAEVKSSAIISLNSLPWNRIPTMDIAQGNIILKDIPYLTKIEDVPLWGATAMMLSELQGWINNVKFSLKDR